MRKALQSAGVKNRKKNIALLGFMGSGKSTAAGLLGKKCGMRMIETDDMVERKAGMKISEIFERHGETRFRALEARAVEDACKQKGAVISLGGGAMLNAASARAVQKTCITVWLWASADEALARLEGDASRPLLNRKDRAKVARRMLRTRLPIYAACADLVIGTERKTAKNVAEMIMAETAVKGIKRR